MAKCHVCGCGPFDAALHRVNEKGVVGVWACTIHYRGEQGPVPEDVATIITVVEQDNRDKTRRCRHGSVGRYCPHCDGWPGDAESKRDPNA